MKTEHFLTIYPELNDIILKQSKTKTVGIYENESDIIILDDGLTFEGTRSDFRNCFFDNAQNDVIIEYCKKENIKLEIVSKNNG
jgi:hypothetical protein